MVAVKGGGGSMIRARFSSRWLGAGLLSAGLFQGCGGSAVNPSESSSSFDHFVSSVSQIRCENLARCCPAQNFAFDGATCLESAQRALRSENSALDFSRLHFDGNLVESCIAGNRAWLSSCTESPAALDACNATWTPTA